MKNWEIIFNEMADQMKREYANGVGRPIQEKDLLAPGMLCAYVSRDESVYRRAMIVTCTVKDLNKMPMSQAKPTLLAKVFFFDIGKFGMATESNLFYFGT
jgi:hypothetical protein